MGLILDSSVLISAERQGRNARQMLATLARTAGETEVALSVVTLIELAHGAARADTAERKAKREQFIQELLMALPIHPVTVAIALRAGLIDGENQAKGVRLPLADRRDGDGTRLQRSHRQSPSLSTNPRPDCDAVLVRTAQT
jgi:predicted nucleic acid-binding protein